MRTTRRTAGTVLALGLVATMGLGACGDDDEEGTDTDTTEADADLASDAGGASPEFCDGFVAIDAAFAEVPEDPAQIEAFVAERITPNVETVEANLPDEVGDHVTTMLEAVDTVVTTGDFSALESPEFAEASGIVYPFVGEECGYQTVEVSAVDFGYEGVPASLEAGTTVFTMTNDSTAGEAHELGLVRIRDGVDKTLDELLSLPEAEMEQYLEFGSGVYAPAGAAGGTTIDLQPGRYVYACFIPVGSIDGAEGSGPPHFVEGMAGEFTVS